MWKCRVRLANCFDLCLLVERRDACVHGRPKWSFRRVASAARGRRRPEPRREGRAKGSRGVWAACVLRVPVVGKKDRVGVRARVRIRVRVSIRVRVKVKWSWQGLCLGQG